MSKQGMVGGGGLGGGIVYVSWKRQEDIEDGKDMVKAMAGKSSS